MNIQKLQEHVVHQIAAGEIIASPRNALKELLENSLDSGATKIDVVVADGGFKLLSVTDNGCGIAEEDLPILCQRFTTSKIRAFEDITNVSTLGFRGEALASISHISHLKVVTKRANQDVAVSAAFEAGELRHTKPIAGLQGTQVNIESLFFNNASRLKSLRSRKSHEYAGILEVVTRYAIEYPGTFSCKQQGDAQPTVIEGRTQKDKIARVFGSKVAGDLLELINGAIPPLGVVEIRGYVSNLDYSSSRTIPYIFFVNGRLVECRPLQRAIQGVYSLNRPKSSSFVFLSLKLESQNVDVNVHPKKTQVSFLYEQEIIEKVCENLESLLNKQESTRSYSTQSLISSRFTDPDTETRPNLGLSKGGTTTYDALPSTPTRYEYKLVRTDPKQSTLASFKVPKLSPRKTKRMSELDSEDSRNDKDQSDEDMAHREPLQGDRSTQEAEQSQPLRLKPRQMNLKSISKLKKKVSDALSPRLTKLLMQHTFVGVVDANRGLAAIQFDVRLYLANFRELSFHLFYQLGLMDFSNFGTIHLGNGIAVEELLELAGIQSDHLDQLETMSEMLEDYFKIKLVSKEKLMVTQLPLMLLNYAPSFANLPKFFAQLLEANWDSEEDCLHDVLVALAHLHVPVSPSTQEVENIFDTIKRKFIATADLQPSIIEIASLPELYKVFERC